MEDLIRDHRVTDRVGWMSIGSVIESKNEMLFDKRLEIDSVSKMLKAACGYERVELDFIAKLLQHPSFDATEFNYDSIVYAMDNERRDIIDLFLTDKRLDVCNNDDTIRFALIREYIHFVKMFFNHASFRPDTVTPTMIRKLWKRGKTESMEAIVLNGKIDMKESSLSVIDLFLSPDGDIKPGVSPKFILTLFAHPLLSIGKQVNRFLRYFMKTKDTLHINMCLSMPHVKPFSVACRLVEWILDQDCDDEMAQILVAIAEDYPNYSKEIAQSVKENERWMHYLSLYPRIEEILIADYGSIAPEDSMTQKTLDDFVTVTTRKRQRTMHEFVTCKRVKK